MYRNKKITFFNTICCLLKNNTYLCNPKCRKTNRFIINILEKKNSKNAYNSTIS